MRGPLEGISWQNFDDCSLGTGPGADWRDGQVVLDEAVLEHYLEVN